MGKGVTIISCLCRANKMNFIFFQELVPRVQPTDTDAAAFLESHLPVLPVCVAQVNDKKRAKKKKQMNRVFTIHCSAFMNLLGARRRS